MVNVQSTGKWVVELKSGKDVVGRMTFPSREEAVAKLSKTPGARMFQKTHGLPKPTTWIACPAHACGRRLSRYGECQIHGKV